MKKVILILFITCLVCACGQKGPLVPPETIISEMIRPGIQETLSSHF
ncbi:MAG: lipoprotein [Pseudohongiellaceae bacterium]